MQVKNNGRTNEAHDCTGTKTVHDLYISCQIRTECTTIKKPRYTYLRKVTVKRVIFSSDRDTDIVR